MAVSVGAVVSYNAFSNKNVAEVSAKTVSEIQEERAANEQKIAEYEKQIEALAGNEANEKQYQETLMEQIQLIRDNIALLNTELESIENDIKTAQDNIEQLDKTIIEQQNEIDNSVELFKERLCAMYVSGNDNLASIIVGSSDFYDIMSRVEMANRMAAYDEELINGILADIETLEKNKSDLESEKLTLDMKLESQQKKKEEKEASLEEFDKKMEQTQAEIDRIQKEQSRLEGDKADLVAKNKALQADEDAIIAETIRKENERIAEEKRQEEARRQQLLQQQTTTVPSNNGGNETVTSPTVTEPPYTPPVTPSAGFMWPAPGCIYISSGFGPRWGSMHNGMDIGDAGIHGKAAVAAQSGTVIAVSNSCTHDYPKEYGCGCGGNYGNYVLISHDGTYSTRYAHLSSVSVSVGDYVSQGQTIGYIGSTGWSTGDHLHFEVYVNGAAQDPMNYVSR